jgi:hypothetical protein
MPVSFCQQEDIAPGLPSRAHSAKMLVFDETFTLHLPSKQFEL